MTSRCVVVIGHVDHGKTALVRALTGMETDVLPEEQARGLTIAPGFAHQSYPDGTIDFVDAPGHADFVAAMVRATSGAQAALLVVSAVDGVQEQTLEHLSIAGMLGLRTGVVALTKMDLLDPAEQATCIENLRNALSGSALEDAPIVPCSAQSGFGLDALNVALCDLLEVAITRDAPRGSFLPIDRVFSRSGRGTIVTGTLQGQPLSVDDPMTLEPVGRAVTLRGLQSRGSARDRVDVGERMAANLRGIAVEDVPRGAVLCRAGLAAPSSCFDVHLSVQPSETQPLKHMQDVRVLWGTSSAVAQLRLFGGGRLVPGAQGFAQLRFKSPVIGFAGQRAVLRRLSPARTIAGATILDAQASATGSGDVQRLQILQAAQVQDAGQIAKAMIDSGRGVAQLIDVERLSRGVQLAPNLGLVAIASGLISDDSNVEAASAQLRDRIAGYHWRFPLHYFAPRAFVEDLNIAPALLRHIETDLRAQNRIRVRDAELALMDHDPVAMLTADQRTTLRQIEQRFEAAHLSVPDVQGVPDDPDLMALLIEQGALLSLSNVALNQRIILHRDSVVSAATTLAQVFPDGGSFSTSEARIALDTSRKVIVPLLEHLDASGITARTGNTRHITAISEVSPPAPPC